MKGIILGLYNGFRCSAGSCNYTCCSGWRIVVSDEDFKRFGNIQDRVLREDILSNIYKADGTRYFSTKSGGKCSMLDKDGLCRIQRNAGEEMLCNTCRKFPRLAAKHNGLLWISMAASCPVTADYIVNKEIEFYKLGNKGDISAIKMQDIPFIASEMCKYREIFERYITSKRTAQDYIYMYNCFMEIADDILGTIIKYKEIVYLEGSFDYFEKEKSAAQIVLQFEEFDSFVKERYKNAFANYLEYRIFSRYLELPDEKQAERFCQVYGELELVYIIALNQYFTIPGGRDSVELEKIINWVYRLCAHGLGTGMEVHEMFCKGRTC
ncbi:MAG: hypothetical protein HFH68_00100 [Lachnospiraceae bacterium]|nr:hypothetical protein [Lachnospiraceae bacterium]